MNKKFKLIFIISFITLSLILMGLLFDSQFNHNQLCGPFSYLFHRLIDNWVGNFSFLFIFQFFLSALLLLFPLNRIHKIASISGIFLLFLLIPPVCHAYRIGELNGGFYGIIIGNIITKSGFLLSFFIFTSWLLTSLLLILFPFFSELIRLFPFSPNISVKKNKSPNESQIIHQIPNILPAKKITNRHQKNIKRQTPWISKVIYESTENRLEIPLVPGHTAPLKKFKLINKENNQEEYQEIPDEISENAVLPVNGEETSLQSYYSRLRENWPSKWQQESIIINPSIQNHLDTHRIVNEQNENKIDLPVEKEFSATSQQLPDEEKELVLINPSVYANRSVKPAVPAEIELEEIEDTVIDHPDKTTDKEPDWHLANTALLNNFKTGAQPTRDISGEQKESAQILEETLQEFGIKANVTEIIHGPVVTLYKLIPAPGIKLQKIESLSNNLALRLAAKSIRIIAPIPGEKVVGIEIPNREREMVFFKEIITSAAFTESNQHIPIGLGKDIYGNIIVVDLYKMPHILIAGATGAGKSVCVNSIIASILFAKKPDDLKLILIDPKIVELKPYNNIPHLLTPVITDPKKAILTLKYLLFEMERRYSLMDTMGARDIVEYQKRKKKILSGNMEDLPFIVAIIDEFADLMSTSGKEAEILFARLAAKARATGIHLVLATQRPSTDVITGLIKANIPARVAFQVISLMNSRIILDQKGAEKLLGQGDMLYVSPSQPFPVRLQGIFLSKEEVDTIAEHWKKIAVPNYINIEELIQEEEIAQADDDFILENETDPLFKEALEIVYETQKASASYLQRRLGIGYNRAARMVEEMEKMGIVGPQRGSKPREIINSSREF